MSLTIADFPTRKRIGALIHATGDGRHLENLLFTAKRLPDETVKTGEHVADIVTQKTEFTFIACDNYMLVEHTVTVIGSLGDGWTVEGLVDAAGFCQPFNKATKTQYVTVELDDDTLTLGIPKASGSPSFEVKVGSTELYPKGVNRLLKDANWDGDSVEMPLLDPDKLGRVFKAMGSNPIAKGGWSAPYVEFRSDGLLKPVGILASGKDWSTRALLMPFKR